MVCGYSLDLIPRGSLVSLSVPLPNPGTPFTPMANLKMLIAAASSALDRERELECAATREDSNLSAASEVGSVYDGASVMGDGDDGGGRKMKSLSVLCKR